MFGEEKNLKDSTSSPSSLQGEGRGEVGLSKVDGLSYKKTHKLITALYMVTDIIDKGEPIRHKLRNLGAEIISDMHRTPVEADNKIAEAVSFLNIASAMNFISEMNCTILKKEFFELKASINDYADMKPVWLADFFNSNDAFPPPLSGEDKRRGFNSPHQSPLLKGEGAIISKGHTNLGLQKGSTLLKALSDKINSESRPNALGLASRNASHKDVFDVLKKERHDSIIKIIKTTNGGATIKDIKDRAKAMPEQAGALVSCSEKTLQRELVSLVKNGVLNKTGEKRWSRYFISN